MALEQLSRDQISLKADLQDCYGELLRFTSRLVLDNKHGTSPKFWTFRAFTRDATGVDQHIGTTCDVIGTGDLVTLNLASLKWEVSYFELIWNNTKGSTVSNLYQSISIATHWKIIAAIWDENNDLVVHSMP